MTLNIEDDFKKMAEFFDRLGALEANRDALLLNARGVLKAFAAGIFVRDISGDSDPAWAVKALPAIGALANLEVACVEAERQQAAAREGAAK